MATLYVENIPKDLYESLRTRAKKHRKSIAAEILTMLEENFPSEQELKKRRRLFQQLEQARASAPVASGPFPSTEQMQRQDRER